MIQQDKIDNFVKDINRKIDKQQLKDKLLTVLGTSIKTGKDGRYKVFVVEYDKDQKQSWIASCPNFDKLNLQTGDIFRYIVNSRPIYKVVDLTRNGKSVLKVDTKSINSNTNTTSLHPNADEDLEEDEDL